MTDSQPMQRLIYGAEALAREHPPQLHDRNKRVVHGIACPPGTVHRGEVEYSRWAPMPLQASVDASEALERVDIREGIYDYVPVVESAVEWHVNFADPDLFFGYGSSLFAQDEMQVAEHPILGSLREALIAGSRSARTVEEGRPTPILVAGVERRCRVAVNASAEEGRPQGLYGNLFSMASEEAVKRATRRILPPTLSNLIAVAAPSGGWGPYSKRGIEYILTTAYTGFRAAVMESKRIGRTESQVVVHTGFWGCGAFGGNRHLMAILQILAAGMAEVDRLVFHAVSAEGMTSFEEAVALIVRGPGRARIHATDAVIEWILDQEFQWGVSDGN